MSSLGLASQVRAEPRPYRGPHPLDHLGNWHLEDSVHVHDTLPIGLEPFAEIDGVLVFLADPEAYGYTGEVWAFRGTHPLPARVGEYCGIRGEHRHPFAPEGEYRVHHGVHRFVGTLQGGVTAHRPGRARPSEPIAARQPRTPAVPRVPPPAYVATPVVYPYAVAPPLHHCQYVTVRRDDFLITTGFGHGCTAPVIVHSPPVLRDRRFGEPIPLVVPRRERPPAHW